MRLAALALGFDDALTTETSAAEIAGRLALLEERARVHGPIASLLSIGGDIDLDLAARELRCPTGPIHLRPKEFGLLALLASHPGRVFTRSELLDRVWGPGHPLPVQDGGRPRPVAALEDRAGPRPARASRHGPGRGLPVRPAAALTTP